jgi:hypothetical protein
LPTAPAGEDLIRIELVHQFRGHTLNSALSIMESRRPVRCPTFRL